jgi:hypothetical protein
VEWGEPFVLFEFADAPPAVYVDSGEPFPERVPPGEVAEYRIAGREMVAESWEPAKSCEFIADLATC